MAPIARPRGLEFGLIFVALTAGQLPLSPAEAAQPPAIEEVVVTVTKREATTFDVPLSVSAFTGADIEAAGIDTVEDIALLTPGLTFAPLFGGDASTPVIRGLTTTIGEPNVGIFVDGVYQSSRTTMTSLLGNFVERIEVAKGPQSVLYGRNTFGGAINYVTKRAADELEVALEATAGSDGKLQFSGSLSGPLAPELLYYRAAAMWSERDGFFDNGLTGGDLDDRETQAYFVSLLATPTPALDIEARVGFEDTDDGDDPLLFVENNAEFFAPLGDFQIFRGEFPELGEGDFAKTPGGKQLEHLTTALTIDWDLGPAVLTSITAFNDLDFRRAVDADHEAREIRFTTTDIEQEEWSQELRLTSAGDGRLQWLAGLYFYFLDVETTNRDEFVGPAAALPPPFNAIIEGIAPSLLNETKEETDEYAAFGQISFDFTDNVRIAVGGRWFIEEKRASAVDTFLATGTVATFRDKARFEEFTPQVIVDWRVHPDHLLYGSVSRSVKSGGFNVVTAAGAILPEERTYDPESSIHHEIGLKSRWFDGRLRTSIAGYKIDWDDQIVRALGATFAVLNANAAETTAKGVELEFQARPFERLDLRGGLAYTDSRFDRYTFGALAGLGVDPVLDGTELQYVSEWTANVSAQYTHPALIGPFDWFARVDAAWQDEQATVQTADAVVGDRANVNLRTGFAGDAWSLTFWVENLLDDDTPVTGVFIPNRAVPFDLLTGGRAGFQVFQGLVTAQNPRAWGVTARYRF